VVQIHEDESTLESHVTQSEEASIMEHSGRRESWQVDVLIVILHLTASARTGALAGASRSEKRRGG
jgi:hypothetical protein